MTDTRRVAVITGAGSGIGRAVARTLQKNQFNVVLSGRRTAELEKTAAECDPLGGTMRVAPVDVCDSKSVAQLFFRSAGCVWSG